MRSAWGCHSHRHLRTGKQAVGKPPGAWTGEVRNKTFPAASQGAFLELCTLLPHSSSAPQWPRLVCNLVLPWTEWEHELGDHLVAFLLPWEACVHRLILFLRPVIWILDSLDPGSLLCVFWGNLTEFSHFPVPDFLLQKKLEFLLCEALSRQGLGARKGDGQILVQPSKKLIPKKGNTR